MNAVDGSDHYERTDTEPAPSLLTVVLDTNPHAWAVLEDTLPLSKAIANILVFINAHLAFNNANQVAVVASHSHRAEWLYPRVAPAVPRAADGDVEMGNAGGDVVVSTDANKYQAFAVVEQVLHASIRRLLATTTPADTASTHTTQMAGALTLALSYIHKATLALTEAGMAGATKPADAHADAAEPTAGLQSRILVVSVSGDLAHQYIPIMNTTFAAQRLRIPIDIVKLAGDTVFLQQASDATKGTYMQLQNPQGLLQYLMMAFLPDQTSRQHLITPTEEVVDFRAACFCHRRVVDVGFVCSICLSIFCSPPDGAVCMTCGTHLALGDYGSKPAVVPRKKKKKKKPINGTDTGSGHGTPVPMNEL